MKKQSQMKRVFALVLSMAVAVSGVNMPYEGARAKADVATVISISSAEELEKIGKDKGYPLTGDYVLKNNIDLNGKNWIPIGGSSAQDYGLVSGDNVFTGTFDGKGYVISNLNIEAQGTDSKNFSGLFGMIGSGSESDYAEIKNIVFSDVNISHVLGNGDSIGTLAGSVNGFVKIANIAVTSGNIKVQKKAGSSYGDLVGVGGIVGQVRANGEGVQMSHLYNAANVTVSDVSTNYIRCGGILGRIHQTIKIGQLTSCLNKGSITFASDKGYGINGFSNNINDPANKENISNCYILAGSGVAGAATELSKEDLNKEEIAHELGEGYWEVNGGVLIPAITKGKVIIPIPDPVYAEGDSKDSVTKNFTLPESYYDGGKTVEIQWTSSNTSFISITGYTASVTCGMADEEVTLTATAGDRTKTVRVIVPSNLEIEFQQKYAKPGTPLTAAVKNKPNDVDVIYEWKVEKTIVSKKESYTPVEGDLNHFISVTVKVKDTDKTIGTKEMYCSKLPVVYVDTADGYGITSKEIYKDATMRIQGNDKFNSENSTLYDGAISIRGRGNSTWNTSFNKLPYKIKLDKKTDVFGFGKNKHWTLLANYMDESLIRNRISYDLSGAMGIVYLKSTNVDVIFNGKYTGNYQFVGNVRIDETRANVYDWEDCAENAADAIAKANGFTKAQTSALEDQMNEHMEWITSDEVNYNGTTYKVSDSYKDIPKTKDGEVDVSGGFLFELDQYFDEVSKFRTTRDQPIMFKSPEFVHTNKELFTSAQDFIQAVEDSFWADDHYVTYQGKRQHYSDLIDMKSFVNYFLLNEFFWNTETMKKSTYMYKDLGKKLVFGPVWDMDWTSNSIVSQNETSDYSAWVTVTRNVDSQSKQWYKAVAKDPYFLTKVYECYQANRQNFEDIVKEGGKIDEEKAYLKESAEANQQGNFLMHDSSFQQETERLRTFLQNRLAWLDQQFESLDTFAQSLGYLKTDPAVTLQVDAGAEGKTTYTAAFAGKEVKKAGFYLNGILAGTAEVADGKAVYTADDSYLTRESDKLQVVQVRGMSADERLLADGAVTNYTTFKKEVKGEDLTGNVKILGEAKSGYRLTVEVTDTNNSGDFSYQWLSSGKKIEGETGAEYIVKPEQEGKTISVEVKSSVQMGTLISEPTAEVTREVTANDHIIIHQVYGGGGKGATSVSHNFVELYNPTDKEIDLSSYTLGYLSKGKNAPADPEIKLTLTGKIPARTSYLIRGKKEETDLAKFTVDQFDQEWDQAFDNKQYRMVLYDGADIIDAISVGEGSVEGAEFYAGDISKQKTIRRKNFDDTNSNVLDFEVIDYSDPSVVITDVYPRSTSDGAWGDFYVVTFDVDGRKENVKVLAGEKVSSITKPQKDGYEFDGWYLGDKVYDFESAVTADMTLTAKWKKKEEGTQKPTPGTPTPGIPTPGKPNPGTENVVPKIGETRPEGDFEYKVTGADTVEVLCLTTKGKKKSSIKVYTSVTFANKSFRVDSIAPKAFQGNKKIKSVVIGKNVSKIGNSAFAKCTNLKKVTCSAGSKLTTIGSKVFRGDKKLSVIILKGTKLKTVGKSAFSGIAKNAKIKVAKSKLKQYQKLLKGKGQKSSVKITK